ncbi:MAG TPA: ABC transporter ATP-binding protein, partial [Candidatus Methylomirabilis sp.]|nr:ABC transporter ATP-binding protein [Candidatus Methylomirabilis sp.]
KIYDGAGARVTALANVSLAIAPGEFVALMGPSGCGKSTLLHLIAGVDLATTGEVWVDGRALAQLSDRALSQFRRDRVGIVYQFYNLLPTMSAWENVALPALLAGSTAGTAHQKAEERLRQVGMLNRRDHWPHELSGGELQRVAIARALVNSPAVLLADEPTGNLDSKAGQEVLELLGRLNAVGEVTILLATHSQEAAAFACRTIHLRDGMISREG